MENTEYQKQQKSDEVISLKDIILTLRKYLKQIIKKWWLIALIAIPIVGYYTYKALNTPWTYAATEKFIIEGETGRNLGGLGSLLGSFGIGGGNSKINPHKVIEVTRSKVIMDQLLFDSTSYNDQIIANELLDLYKLSEKWGEASERFIDFRFTTNDPEKLTLLEKRGYKRLSKFVVGRENNRDNALLKISIDDETGIYKLKVKTISEAMSLCMSTKVFDYIKNFFEYRIFEKQKQTRDLLESKKDSLKHQLNIKSLNLANFMDRSRGSISTKVEMQRSIRRAEINGLTIAFHEAYKNYEVSDFALRNAQPLFLEVDRPFAPLSPNGPILMINIIIGLILSFILGVIIIVLRRIVLDAMTKE